MGSGATVAFEEATCDEPSYNKQIAHSQIVVVIALSLSCDRPFQLPFTIVCFGLLTFAFACVEPVAYSFVHPLVSCGLFDIAICLRGTVKEVPFHEHS